MKFYIIYCVQICFCVQSIVKARLDQPMIALKNLIRLASAPAMQNTDWHLIMPYIKIAGSMQDPAIFYIVICF